MFISTTIRLADSDLDGLCAAAVLKAANPNAQVVFAHAALIRSGAMDSYIDENTAIVDLPFHENCGWYLDHHLTNRPSPKQEEKFIARGGVCHWEATPSAARLAYDGGGTITGTEFLSSANRVQTHLTPLLSQDRTIILP